jgi:uncharacterized protein
MFLIDTNCWMQLARERSEADSVRQLIGGVPLSRIFVSIFTVHSIGVILRRRGMIDQYVAFLDASSIGSKIQIVHLDVHRFSRITNTCSSYNLDFDDSYQYVAAELNNLTLVSLDADFDRTPRGRLTPAAALQKFKDEQSQPQQEA